MNLNFNLMDHSRSIKKGHVDNSNYQDEMRLALKTQEDLNHYFQIKIQSLSYKTFIPRNFALKIKKSGQNSALWKQFIPDQIEDNKTMQEFGLTDPIGDTRHQKSGPIIHRYENRLLFFPTNICPIACRYCFRKNELDDSPDLFTMQYTNVLKYLEENKQVEEIIFSGGDPLILSDSKIKNYLDDFSRFEHIKYIRFHTRTPIILPSRITTNLINIFKDQSKKIIIAIHANHASEIDSEVSAAINRLKKSKAMLLSQSVLLKGVNDTTQELYELMHKFIGLDIRPYYLHHPDRVKGAMHFYLSLENGRHLFANLKSLLSGWMCPQYIIDIPGGEGKTQAYNPESFSFSGNLINKDGKTISITPTLDARIRSFESKKS